MNNSVKMIFTLFAFCFIAALLLAFVDSKTYPIREKLNHEKEMRARKEVLFMKDGGLNIDNFPPGKYQSIVEKGKNEAEFICKNGELEFSKLIINGTDYIEANRKYIEAQKGESASNSPAFVLLKSFNEYHLIKDTDNITGASEDIKKARKFLKKNRKFVSSLITVLMAPVEYREIKAIEIELDEKKEQLILDNDEYKLGDTPVKIEVQEGFAKFISVADKKAQSGTIYQLYSGQKLVVNELNEYQVRSFFTAYYGDARIGTVIKIEPNCFADKIQTVIGINSQNRVSGIKILKQAETPGLGARVTEVRKGENEPWWQSKFHGLKPDELYLKNKDEKKGKIDVITAATITPRKLTRGIRKSVKKFIALKESMEGGTN